VGIALAVALMGLAVRLGGVPTALAGPSENVCASCTYTTIQSAIDAATGNTIIYVAPGTYLENLIVDSPNTSATYITLWATPSATVDGKADGDPVLFVGSGRTVVAMNMNFTHGSDITGGGIVISGGTVSLLGTSSVYGNTATDSGGGIFNEGGTLTLHNSSSVHNNGAAAFGAGVENDDGGSVTLEDTSSIYDNPSAPPIAASVVKAGIKANVTTAQAGGGISSDSGSVTLEDNSRVHDNFSVIAGGIANSSCVGGGETRCPPATLTLEGRASVDHNFAELAGGVENSLDMTMLGSASVHDNIALGAGGILNVGSASLRNTSSVYGNAAFLGGGITNGYLLVDLFLSCLPDCFIPLSSRLTSRAVSGGNPFGSLLQPNQIVVDSTVTLRDFSTVHDNQADLGAGILNAVGESFVSANSSVRPAALPPLPFGVLMQGGSSVYHNTASETLLGMPIPFPLGAAGAGVVNLGSLLVMTDDASVHDNSVTLNQASGLLPNAGGGIGNALSETFMADRSSVYRNSAPDGAGIYNFDAMFSMSSHSSVHHNAASNQGGGMNTTGGSVSMTGFSSIDHNVAADGGGIYNGGGNGFALWGFGAVTFNKPNNCSPANTVSNCSG
jgi:hypothetical protein